MRFIGPPLTAEEAKTAFRVALVATTQTNPSKVFLVVENRISGAAIGICAVPQMDLPKKQAEVGMILRKESCNRGLGQEGLSALIDQTFATLPVNEIWVQYRREHQLADGMVNGMGFMPCEPRNRQRTDPNSQRFRYVLRETWRSGSSLNVAET